MYELQIFYNADSKHTGSPRHRFRLYRYTSSTRGLPAQAHSSPATVCRQRQTKHSDGPRKPWLGSVREVTAICTTTESCTTSILANNSCQWDPGGGEGNKLVLAGIAA